ncbi:MAG: hypothetical protein KatS3mg060_2827 [Dehalococcoidia bacterium]|nr:MAG: hypothetical protein KatS3mg060_2827 [Dehalococcoidia bacterium]
MIWNGILTAVVLAASITPSREIVVTPQAIVPTGLGSYTTILPPGAKRPPVLPAITPNVTGAVPTNDWWTSLVWKTYPDHHSENLFAHPWALRARAGGLAGGYPAEAVITPDGRKYETRFQEDLVVGLAGLNAAPAEVRLDAFSDWTVTADWAGALKVTFGHGLPFLYAVRSTSADALITFARPPQVRANDGNAIHVSIDGRDYAIFAPAGASWSIVGTTLRSDLAGKNYFSVAILPDPRAFADFRAHAFAFVTGGSVAWRYDAAASAVITTFTASSVAKEGKESRPLLALYRHQWLNGATPNTEYRYRSARGEMRVLRGPSFITRHSFGGILPALPSVAGLDTARLRRLVDEIASKPTIERFGGSLTRDTYWMGKMLQRLALLVPIADQIGHYQARDSFLADLKAVLQDWFTASPGEAANLFYYDDRWGTLIGYAASYGSDDSLNDHHFHYGYFVHTAAVIARYDPAWARAWGPMVELLIKDVANPDPAADPRFPRLRTFDPYAGHSWASGNAPFAAGNNQESSSEAMNFAAGVALWGMATDNPVYRDLGIYLFTTEASAIEQYWFDVDRAVFPQGFGKNALGILWGDGGSYSTWWSPHPEEIRGINMLPITPASLYLGRRPEYVLANYAQLVEENGPVETVWPDIIWSFLALADAPLALAKLGEGAYDPEGGETRAHTYHWIATLNGLGRVDTTVAADTPSYAVVIKDGVRTCVAANLGLAPLTARFTNGAALEVAPRSLASATCAGDGGSAPPAGPPASPAPPPGSHRVHIPWVAAQR